MQSCRLCSFGRLSKRQHRHMMAQARRFRYVSASARVPCAAQVGVGVLRGIGEDWMRQAGILEHGKSVEIRFSFPGRPIVYHLEAVV